MTQIDSHIVAHLRHARASLVATGGFTVSVTGQHSPTSGYALSLNPTREKVVGPELPSIGTLLFYAYDNLDLLTDSDKYFGAWADYESGNIYLDVVTVVEDRAEALELARLYDQLAVFDLETRAEVRV